MIELLILVKSMPSIVAQGLLLFGFIVVIGKVMGVISDIKTDVAKNNERILNQKKQKENQIKKEKEYWENEIEPIAIDLGLSIPILWSSVNVGAKNNYVRGKLFSWASTKCSTFKSTTLELLTNSLSFEDLCVLFNCHNGDYSGNQQFDAATNNWNKKWRTPRDSEFRCLIDECEWEWISEGNFSGWRITGPNGNSIKLPMDQGYNKPINDVITEYWTSTPDIKDNNKANILLAYLVRITQAYKEKPKCIIEVGKRTMNCYIRPVMDKL